MFDFGVWGELIIILIVALVLIGPKDLPGLVKSIARIIYKIRKSVGEFKSSFDDVMHEVEREDIMTATKDKPDDRKP
jgi:sec-independent protein translocase protein TatB